MKNIFDGVKYRRIESDIKNFCVLLNEELKALSNSGLLMENPPAYVVRDICALSSKEAQNLVKSQFNEDIEKLPVSMRLKQTEDCREICERIGTHIDKFRKRVSENGLALGLRLDTYERLNYIRIEDGKAMEDREAMEKDCTVFLENNKMAQDLENRVKSLHSDLADLDVIVRKLTNNRVALIGNPLNGGIYLIETCYGKIVLNLDKFAYFNWDDYKKTGAQKTKTPDTERYIVRT